MRFDITWHPLDEGWLAATFVAALAGKPVGPETFNLASRWAHRKLFKSISDSYKRAALKLARDTAGFDLEHLIWGRPYFIVEPDAQAATDELVELETLRDSESVFEVFNRQLEYKPLRGLREQIEALALQTWETLPVPDVQNEAIAEFRALVRRAEVACEAAEGGGRVRATTQVAEVRRRQTEPLRSRYDPTPLDGLRSRSGVAAKLSAAGEMVSYSAVVWLSKVAPLWQQQGVVQTLSRLCTIFPELRKLTEPPGELFDGLHSRYSHISAAMAQQLDNNYSAGRFVPAFKVGEFIGWWRANHDDLQNALSDDPYVYQKVLEAALYARVKNWSLIEASDVLPPFTERLP